MSSFDVMAETIFALYKEELLPLQDDRPQLIEAWRALIPPLGPSISKLEWDTQLERLLALEHAGDPSSSDAGSDSALSIAMQPAQDSWERPFNGSALGVLLEALDNLAVAATEPSFFKEEPLPIYARVLSCVQSSGTGKSRLLHEAALKVFTLPVCWRTKYSTGYPVRDASVCELFKERAPLSPRSSEQFWQAFLTALLLETAKCIDIGKLTSEPEQWRTFFNQGMTSSSHNRNRLAFFRAVTETTKALLPSGQGYGNLDDEVVYQFRSGERCHSLETAGSDLEQKLRSSTVGARQCRLNIVFDEAHLAFNFPLLSTSSAIRELMPLQDRDPSNRVRKSVFAPSMPFSFIGWDQSYDINVRQGSHGSDQFAKLVHFGRPLFGSTYLYQPTGRTPEEKEKEIIDLATFRLLSENRVLQSFNDQQLLALFGSLLPLSLSLRARPTNVVYEMQDDQVRHHLAILDRYYPHVQAMCVIRPSEPVLALAAGAALEMPKGERGEMIAMLLLIASQYRTSTALQGGTTNADAFPYRASVLFTSSLRDYLQQLLLWPDAQAIPPSLAAGCVRVCQFIKREQNSLPAPEDLAAAHERGCAFACYFNQRGTNLILPVVFQADRGPGAVIIEVKARDEFGPQEQHNAINKLRETRAEIFTAAERPPCALILIDFAMTATAQNGSRNLDVYTDYYDDSSIIIIINGLQSLRVLDGTDATPASPSFKCGTREQVQDLLQKQDTMDVITASQNYIRQLMDPLCGCAPGYRQFWSTDSEQQSPTAGVDSLRVGPHLSHQTVASTSDSKKRKEGPSL